jgi:hypothetical protein
MSPGGGSVEDLRAVVVRGLRARQDELVQAIFARMHGDAFDRGGDQDAEYLAGLRATVAAALEYVFEGIERGEEGVGPVPVTALEQARHAARIGVPLDTVLRRYVVGSALLGEVILEEADRGERGGWGLDQRRALRGALRAQASVLDRLLQAITVEYGDELARTSRSPEQRRSERVRRLLDGATIEGSELNYELDAWHLGVIALGEGAAHAVRELAAGVDRRLLSVQQSEHSVWAWLGGRGRLALVDVERAIEMGSHPPIDAIGLGGTGLGEMGSYASEGVVFALGEPAQGIEGWRLTHRQAQAALAVALRRRGISSPTHEGVTVTRYADVVLLATALKDEALARTLIDIYIAPLEDSRGNGQVLRETLRAYLAAEHSVSSAAAALGVVRKTVASRLRTIEGRLGRSVHPCPAELKVALLLDELDRAPPSPPDPHASLPASPKIPIGE